MSAVSSDRSARSSATSGNTPVEPPACSPVRSLSAGVVAHNDAPNIVEAVRSLVGQQLPSGVAWSDLWVVASGCTDGTEEAVFRYAATDPRVHVLVDPRRRGKAHALRTILDRAQGDAAVLLNGDAVARPGSVASLLERANGMPRGRPFAVMARPVPALASASGGWKEAMATLWELHHDYHVLLEERGGGAHLSDELMLVGLPVPFELPFGTVNDGSYIGVWLAQQRGNVGYAPSARVDVAAPSDLREHLRQRRRIHYGNLEVARRLGRYPSTLAGAAVAEPRTLLRVIARQPRARRPTVAALAAADAFAWGLAVWDSLPPSRSYVRWRRIRSGAPGTSDDGRRERGGPTAHRTAARPHELEERIGKLAALSEEFGTFPPLPELVALLPRDAPATADELSSWLLAHPVRAGGGSVPPDREAPERHARGERYLRLAAGLFEGPLQKTLRWARCVAVSGSVAYGAPDADDDLDFFVVARRGAVWWLLAYLLVAGRLARLRHRLTGAPELCFNRVIDEREAVDEFAGARGLLFAREALTTRPLHGAEYYRGLLGVAGWMAGYLPRLYVRSSPLPPDPAEGAAAPWPVRVANAVVFPPLAVYLQLAGLVRNARYARTGALDRTFRTETLPRRHVIASRRFERLREIYDREGPWETPAGAPAPRAPAATGGAVPAGLSELGPRP